MKKVVWLFLLLILSFNCSTEKKEGDDVLVAVGSAELTRKALDYEFPDQMPSKFTREQLKNFIQQWIEKELIYQSALKIGLDLDADYRLELEKAKKENLIRKYLEQNLLNAEDSVSDEEAFKYFEENKQSFLVGETEVRALHILLATSEEADDARRRILAGEDFEQVAKEVSLDYADKQRIEFDFFSSKDVVPEISSRLFSYREGALTTPIKSPFGYHIFKILERREAGSYKSFGSVKDQITERLLSINKKQKYRDLIIDLRNKIIVKKNDSKLSEIYQDSTFTN